MPSSYDHIPYPGFPFAQSHPDRLASLAIMFGLQPAPVDHCRVLELGCAEGANIIPMAFAFPQSCFVGIDLAENAIHSGCEVARDMGLSNLRLDAADLMNLDPAIGQFDYIIAHGLYSWVPERVRDGLLALIHRLLTPTGIAYVSYNALPGGHIRLMLREMILFHLRDVEDPADRLGAALKFLEMLMSAPGSQENQAPDLLRDEVKTLLEKSPQVLFHDELEENYFPISFTDFTAHAASHGLKYLAEANIFDMESSKFSPDLQKQIEEYSGGDRHLREQYMDFVRCRKFRQTLLCHDSAAILDAPDSRCVSKLYAASSATPDSADPDFSGNTVEAFKGYMGAAMKTAHPLAKTAIGRLIERWPQAIHFSELLALCRETLGAAADPEALEQIVFTTYRVGLVELHAHAPGCVARAGARPATTALARYQAQHGRTITTMRHTSIEATGQVERRLLTLLDGTRDRVALAAELAATMHAAPSPEKLLPDLDKNLARLARFGLLVA